MTPPDTAAADAASWPVLLVCARHDRIADLRQVLAGWPVPVQLHSAAGALQALRQALQHPLHLAVIDWALEGPCGQALVRQLARMRPALPVLAFDAIGLEGSAAQALVRPWSEMPQALEQWRLRVLRAVAAPVSELSS